MTFNPTEKHQSQISALQLLVALGYTPLSQADTLHHRGGRRRNEDILTDRLLALQGGARRDRGRDQRDRHLRA